MIQNQILAKVHKKLVFALESARMQLAVAIATETKSTPRDRWRYYLDTTDQMGRFIRKLRKVDSESLSDSQGLMKALETLEGLPIQSQAFRLCRILRDIMTELE